MKKDFQFKTLYERVFAVLCTNFISQFLTFQPKDSFFFYFQKRKIKIFHFGVFIYFLLSIIPNSVAVNLLNNSSKNYRTNYINKKHSVKKRKTTSQKFFVAPCNAAPGEISGNVFRDFNNTGTKDSLEIGVPEILIKAFDCNGNLLGTVSTDKFGNYSWLNH